MFSLPAILCIKPTCLPFPWENNFLQNFLVCVCVWVHDITYSFSSAYPSCLILPLVVTFPLFFWQGVVASYFSVEDQKILKYLLCFLTLMPDFWVSFSFWKDLFIFRLITNKFASFQDCHSPRSFCLWISLQKCSLSPCKYCSATFLLSLFENTDYLKAL